MSGLIGTIAEEELQWLCEGREASRLKIALALMPRCSYEQRHPRGPGVEMVMRVQFPGKGKHLWGKHPVQFNMDS